MQITLDGVDQVFFIAKPAAVYRLHHTFADFGDKRFRFCGCDKPASEDLRVVEQFACVFIETDIDQQDAVPRQLTAFLMMS